ncbi:hypothetical protein M0802_000394 [Mischocyttarus mexicanus]|nr:hypothetical protein M0802_000394 [Mischocyttarus mexicanus]
MYAENSAEIDEEFFDALALLRPNEDDSAEKLRKMLDEQIEKRYGKSKTLAVRMPKEFLNKEITRCKTYSKNSIKKKFTTDKNIEIIVSDNNNNKIKDKSICNGTKLGPLILLECQECQEIYHPLCHNPAVIDIDVYDPRLVWRCGKCVEVTASSYETPPPPPSPPPLPPPPPPPPPPSPPLLEEDRKDDIKRMINKCSKIVNVEKKKHCLKVYGCEKMFKRRR